MRILAGDIGGTKTELALFETGDPATPARELYARRYPSGDFPGLIAIVEAFLADPSLRAQLGAHPIAGVAFGVAGPVRDRRCQVTNLPWVVDADALQQHLRAPTALINDFAAVALGVGLLRPDELHTLQAGEVDPDGPVCILGAGTGLGEAVLVPHPSGLRVLPSEGGHTDFPPRNPTEVRLLEFLWSKHQRVSVERVVSGLGLPTLFEFVTSSGLATPLPSTLRALAERDSAAVIGELGSARADPACEQALDLFIDLYGAEAGNLSLKVLPTGGLYVAGGIAPKLLASLSDGRFIAAMLDKGRMRGVLEAIHVAVVLQPRVGLWGAAREAAREAGVLSLHR